MILTYKEFRLIENIVKHCSDLLPDIDTISSNYFNRVKDIVNYDISNEIMNGCLTGKAIDNINHECDLFVSCIRCPEDFDDKYPTKIIKYNYRIINELYYIFTIKNDIYCLTIDINNIYKEIKVVKELNSNKFELTIEYSVDY